MAQADFGFETDGTRNPCGAIGAADLLDHRREVMGGDAQLAGIVG